MNRREIIHYIRHETAISEEKKALLIHMLYNHSNNFGSLCRWIKSLNVFTTETFQELLSFERVEVVKILTRGAEESISKRCGEENYEIRGISEVLNHKEVKRSINLIQSEYAYRKIIHETRKRGFSLVQEERLQKGTIKLVLRKVA